MKLTSLAAAALALALLAPVSASAGQVWTDGNYYSACPDELVIPWKNVEVHPRNEWTNLMNVGSMKSVFDRAWIDPTLRRMVCGYKGTLQTAYEPFPADFPNCVVYSGIWFVCRK